MKYYKQCLLKKDNMTTVLWIPENLAKEDKILKMKKGDDWDTGWKVSQVFRIRLTEEEVVQQRDAHLRQRKVSDI